jgi:hypothetical protein
MSESSLAHCQHYGHHVCKIFMLVISMAIGIGILGSSLGIIRGCDQDDWNAVSRGKNMRSCAGIPPVDGRSQFCKHAGVSDCTNRNIQSWVQLTDAAHSTHSHQLT